ncbi:NAD(P)-dependent alcohol dehydrogenase [Granulosicoccus antarcticus]|uniref:Quinone oxidoreductase 1 n=1 Tax=Granulosicoccus antarcticus IMCC3135 TaxID=1192854 RepID=A0A2Z2NZL8_9GAMM|nr:NAD(P)-dependent alcohol dehydrogenase [Granulosicoccus antarcticus]ASJ73257.1 Quinone oxidoreductase 1 [Granulosicoccus antarcticus IMCC3135]
MQKTAAAPNQSTRQSKTHDHLTMQAIVQHRYGSSEVLEHTTIDRPTFGDKEVLIEVHSAGLDRGTWHLMTGTPYLIRILGFGFSKPKQATPGLDVAGRVAAIGKSVSRLAVGDEVFGIANGSFAEYATASEDTLAIKPADLSFEAAAAATVSGVTALEALSDIGQLKAGERVLIVGASGGVGTFAVQLAKAMGAEVTGVASASKSNLVLSLGADHIVDYSTDYLEDPTHQYDLIIDIGGRNKVSSLRKLLTLTGTLVFVGGEGGNRITGGIGRQIGTSLMSIFYKQRLTMFVSSVSLKNITRLREFIESGAVTPTVGKCFNLNEAQTAMREMEAGMTCGKSVIVIQPSTIT